MSVIINGVYWTFSKFLKVPKCFFIVYQNFQNDVCNVMLDHICSGKHTIDYLSPLANVPHLYIFRFDLFIIKHLVIIRFINCCMCMANIYIYPHLIYILMIGIQLTPLPKFINVAKPTGIDYLLFGLNCLKLRHLYIPSTKPFSLPLSSTFNTCLLNN